MRRFLVPVLILSLSLLLSACGARVVDNAKWGVLQVTTENIQQKENQWSANLVVKNPTDKVQIMQYQGAARYSLVITREGETVLEQNFEKIDQPEILNLSAGVSKAHVVVWTLRDSEGNPVEPGTYQATVRLNAVVPDLTAAPKPGTNAVKAIAAPVMGPFSIQVK